MLSSATQLWKSDSRLIAERDSGQSYKLFGFNAESVFTFIPEITVQDHPGMPFGIIRNRVR